MKGVRLAACPNLKKKHVYHLWRQFSLFLHPWAWNHYKNSVVCNARNFQENSTFYENKKKRNAKREGLLFCTEHLGSPPQPWNHIKIKVSETYNKQGSTRSAWDGANRVQVGAYSHICASLGVCWGPVHSIVGDQPVHLCCGFFALKECQVEGYVRAHPRPRWGSPKTVPQDSAKIEGPHLTLGWTPQNNSPFSLTLLPLPCSSKTPISKRFWTLFQK